jgi:hypothetical protein
VGNFTEKAIFLHIWYLLSAFPSTVIAADRENRVALKQARKCLFLTFTTRLVKKTILAMPIRFRLALRTACKMPKIPEIRYLSFKCGCRYELATNTSTCHAHKHAAVWRRPTPHWRGIEYARNGKRALKRPTP